MTISSRSLPFTASLIAAAPHTPGVYALWQNGAVVYYGNAFAGAATIHSALDEHFSGQAWSELRATRCSWEVAEDPERRLSELIMEFEVAHQCMPRWNDPQRLPTS
jgi:hypothetical protein